MLVFSSDKSASKYWPRVIYSIALIRLSAWIILITFCLVCFESSAVELNKLIRESRPHFSGLTVEQTRDFLIIYLIFGVLYVLIDLLLLIATWKRKSWLLKTWMAITSVCTFSDLRSVLFDLMVGSIDIGLAFAVISLIGNLGCLATVFYFERHLVEEKARVFQQTWITTDETRKNGGFESDADTEDAEEIQV